MKVNKNQALYKYLPQSWAEFSEEKRFFTVKIAAWNTKEVTQLFKPKLLADILLNINAFERRGGDISRFKGIGANNITFVEPVMNEGFTDIACDVNPLVFYCNICGKVENVKTKNLKKHPKCSKCDVAMKQLQYVYSCECGTATGVSVPYDIVDKMPKFYAGRNNQFQFTYLEGKNQKTKEMTHKCLSCGKIIYPRNATDRINFSPFSISAVNLLDNKLADFIDSNHNAKSVFIAKWLGEISKEQFQSIIDNPSLIHQSTSDEVYSEELQRLLSIPGVTHDIAMQILDPSNSKIASSKLIGDKLKKVQGEIVRIDSESLIDINMQMIEYEILTNAKRVETLDRSKAEGLKMETIVDGKEIDVVNTKLGISRALLASEVGIINSSYAYTRKGCDPLSMEPGHTLVLQPFYENGTYKVYTSRLTTEGILLEFDRRSIFIWLKDNGLTQDDIDPSDERGLKLWFVNHIKPRLIDSFSDIIVSRIDADTVLTKIVYSLVHTLTHLLIKSTGYISGIDKDSLSEIIFSSIPASFIYSTSVQGISLGALETMFLNNYKQFVEYALSSPENCLLDPICMDEQQGRCFSCLYLSEVTCTHFNKDLSRLLLFGGKLDVAENWFVTIRKGFFSN